MTTFRKTALSLAAVGFIVCTANAQSGESLAPLIRKISYGDLNLETSEGARVLYARLRHAAQDVCSPLNSRELGRKNLWQTCYASALASAVAQVNMSSVTALHQTMSHPDKS